MHNRYVFREEAREMFYHAYNAYMVSAYVVSIAYSVVIIYSANRKQTTFYTY